MKHYSWAVLWAIVVVVLCSIPSESMGEAPSFPGMDKLVHCGFFFVFTVLLYYGAIRRAGTSGPSLGISIRVILVSLLFALTTEFLQWKIFTYRSAEWWDLFADTVGTGMGVFAYLLLHNTYRLKTRAVQLVIGATLMAGLSSCGVFRRGCKCPPVHRYEANIRSLSQRPRDGNSIHLSGSSGQQHSRTGFQGSTRGQHIVH